MRKKVGSSFFVCLFELDFVSSHYPAHQAYKIDSMSSHEDTRNQSYNFDSNMDNNKQYNRSLSQNCTTTVRYDESSRISNRRKSENIEQISSRTSCSLHQSNQESSANYRAQSPTTSFDDQIDSRQRHKPSNQPKGEDFFL